MSEDGSGDEVIAKFDKNSREEVRVMVGPYMGRNLINIRVFCKDKDDQWKPSNKGLAIGVEQYRHLAGAIVRLGEHLQQQGLLPSGQGS
jgi:hypothetical protein